jgi:hypothetical protein
MIKRLLPVVILICGLVFLYSKNFTPHPQKQVFYNSESILRIAQNELPHTGVLKEDRSGFVYLKVDDHYIDQLFPLLHNPEYRKPPYFRRPNAPGAHISVIYSDEHVHKIKELGQTFSFKILDITAVPPKTQEFVVIQIESPELEALRVKYGLSPLLKGHPFHITIAKKKRNK